MTSYSENSVLSSYDNLSDKLNAYSSKLIPKNYRNIVLDIITEYLRGKNIKNEEKYFSKTSLLNYLKENDKNKYNQFKFILLQAVSKLNSRECIKQNLIDLLALISDNIDTAFINDIEKNIS